MSFWGSLFGGQNSTLSSAIPKAGQISGFSTGLGENLLTKSGNFFSDILSGDPTKQMQALAPEISALKGRAQQGKNQLAQFGTRSGGTASAAANIDRETRTGVNNMIQSLTGSAAGAAGSMGAGLLNTGIEALNQQVGFSQQQMENWANSILGQGVSTAIGGAEAFGLGKIPGATA